MGSALEFEVIIIQYHSSVSYHKMQTDLCFVVVE